MEHAARRSALTVAALSTAGALALTPVTVAPLDAHAPVRISTQAVALTDAWTDLVSNSFASAVQLSTMFLGTNNNYPLPTPNFPLAPVATQLVLNQLIYAAQLFTGQGGQIPAEISAHLTEVGKVVATVVAAVPSLVSQQITIPFFAAQQAIEFVTTSTNPLAALFQAPAVFLDIALNADPGLLGVYGPIGISLIIRNLLTKAIYTPPPAIVLPFKTVSSAAAQHKAAAAPAATSKVTTPAGTASSARSKPKAPSSATGSKRKASASSTSDTRSANVGRGHSKRG